MRNDQLDGLRGYAALAVVFFHSILGPEPDMVRRVLYRDFSELGTWYDVWAKLTLKIFSGQSAVVIFFILSGAVLFDSLKRESAALQGGNSLPATEGGTFPARSGLWSMAAKFLVNRFFRIYPALFVCLIACWLAFNLAGLPRSFEQLLLNLSLYDFPINGATWTLNVEAFGAVFLLLAYLAYLRFREPGVIVVASIFGLVYLHAFDGYLLQFRMFIYSFTLGALITTPAGRKLFERIPTSVWPVLLLVMMFSKSTIHETFAALLVGLIYYRKAGALGRFLARPISVFLGTISYSLYLFNVLFLEIFLAKLQVWPLAVAHPVEIGFVAGLVIVALTVPVAYLSVRLIEQPCVRLGRYLTRSWAPRPATPASVSLETG